MKIYMNGSLVDRAAARVSVYDHGLLYGDGVFEGIRVYGGRVFKLAEHIARLYDSAQAIMLRIPMDEPAMANAVERAVKANDLADGYVRLVVTRGEGSLGLDPTSCAEPGVIIIAGPIALYPPECYEQGIAIVTASTRRSPADVLEPRVKSLNYLNNIMAKMEAARAGCREAVMLNAEGRVAECTADNVFIVRGGTVLTPPPHEGALDGITMRAIMELAASAGVPAGFQPLTRYDLYTADECFLTGTGAEIVPVAEVDARRIGRGRVHVPGPVTARLREAFRAMVFGPGA